MSKNDKEKLSDNTHIAVVLDNSGSMHSLIGSTIEGFNEYLDSQRELEGKTTLTLAKFGNRYDLVKDFVSVSTFDGLCTDTYKADGGGTALLDAIGKTVIETDQSISEREEKPDNVVVVIITDGGENASREYKKDDIVKMIQNYEENHDWTFVFIGANQDAFAEAGGMGMRACNTMNYDASAEGTRAMYANLATSTTSYRSARAKGVQQIGFFDDAEAEETE
jgi:hypothetical protein